jgi:predicted RNA-binding Zn ribbon-like protein
METATHTAHEPGDGSLTVELQHTQLGPTPDGSAAWPLFDYDDVVQWALGFGAIDERDAGRLRRQAQRDPDGARAVFERTLRIRATLDDVFRAIATGGRPSAEATARLASDEAEAVGRARLVPDGDRFAWSWADDDSLARPLWPVVHDATRLLIEGPLDRIKACDGCRYLFIDESKNRSRRWCDMSTCGTAEKMRRYVARRAAKRGTAATAEG